MTTAQTNYLKSKAIYDEAISLYTAETTGLDWDNDFDGAFEKDEVIRAKHDVEKKFRAMSADETALIAWAQGQVNNLAEYRKNRVMLDDMFNKARRYPNVYQKVIDLSMGLPA